MTELQNNLYSEYNDQKLYSEYNDQKLCSEYNDQNQHNQHEGYIDIGTQFAKRGKGNKGKVYTVVDELTTTNRAGAIVKVEFLCTHEFCGQQVNSRECATTIKMGLIQ